MSSPHSSYIEFDIEIRDKKGVKNLAADHLSRLENPGLGKLTRAEIRDLFLRSIDVNPNKNNESCVLTESYEDAWPEMRQHKFFDNVTADHLEDIMASPPSQEKSSRPGFTGHISFAMHTAFKTPLGTAPFRIIYGKACHLPIKLEHRAYRAIKNCNMDLTKAGENRFLQINELDEMRLDAYESSISYNERTKRWHDKRIKLPINYEKGDKVLLFNTRLRLKSRWYGPFSLSIDMKNGAIELYDEERSKFIVNKQRVKPYQKNLLDTNRDDDVTRKDQ
ncbi:hypothetical protein Tco_0642581 [Tanacetum coccineum]